MFITLFTFKGGHPPPFLLWNPVQKISQALGRKGRRSNRTQFSLASPCWTDTSMSIHSFCLQVCAERLPCLGDLVRHWGYSNEQNSNLLPKELRFPWCKTRKSKSLPTWPRLPTKTSVWSTSKRLVLILTFSVYERQLPASTDVTMASKCSVLTPLFLHMY